MLTLITRDSQKEVQLSNDSFEDAATIRLFLQLVSHTLADIGGLLRSSSCRPLSKQLLRLVAFLDKYDSEVGVRVLRLYGSEVLLRQELERSFMRQASRLRQYDE